MDNHLDVDYIFEDNDASASAFGWDFQANAGIFLFLKYIKEVDSIMIETKYQDIEIKLKKGIIYAQAKALQDESKEGSENSKLRDALVSLSKITNIDDDDKIVYISNLNAPINGEKDMFRNDVVEYKNCNPIIKKFIKEQVEIIINKLEKNIEEKDISAKNKKKNIALLNKLKDFKYNQFMISSIYPYAEHGDRYKIIGEKLLEMLVDTINMDNDKAVTIKKKVLIHWQEVLRFNATISDKVQRKEINKKDFIWTIIAITIEDIYADFIVDSLSQSIDSSILQECDEYLKREENIYHERFEFLNIIIQDYNRYKKTIISTKADELFVRSEWRKYTYEFDDILEKALKELVTKKYIYKIINKNKLFANIARDVNL